jgi:phage terminase large subunit-like protein
MRDFIQEFLDFPQGKYKDILDATAHALQALRTPDTLEEQDDYEKAEERVLAMRSAVTGY